MMRIDRQALVRRHDPRITALDPFSPFSVGNGEFSFTADITGLQTFEVAYREGLPLCTQSQWGWHTTPFGKGRPNPSRDDLRLESFDADGRPVGYATDSSGQEELFHWLRQNPHRLHLGRLGLAIRLASGQAAEIGDISGINQRLDLWTGSLDSRFVVEGEAVRVRTVCHPRLDLLAVRVESALLAQGRLALDLAFPYGSPAREAADWESASRHCSQLENWGHGTWQIDRQLDADAYRVTLRLPPGAACRQTEAHSFSLSPPPAGQALEACLQFRPAGGKTGGTTAAGLDWESVRLAAAMHWERFWSSGAAVELTASRDSRAIELERRIVLSQYLLAIQSAGSLPPQETGLSCNSWYGKFHLEMHWWHAAWLPLWGRPELLERSLDWYRRILPEARRLAASQGYAGARWPKMVGPEGQDSPSHIGPLLIWQQPHLIHLAWLLRRSGRVQAAWMDGLIRETAEFMISYSSIHPRTGQRKLGPPVIPAQENHAPRETCNPCFELAYWEWGLRAAAEWFRQRGLETDPRWEACAAALSPLPMAKGVYQAHENCPDTFESRNRDHPSFLGAMGVLPGALVGQAAMGRTLDRVLAEWDFAELWGWDFPLIAMTAARLGRPADAVAALMHPSIKNSFSANGHNRQGDVRELPVYLPGNGGLLIAIAMMAAGWEGGPEGSAPGFPSDGSWTVRHEGLGCLP